MSKRTIIFNTIAHAMNPEQRTLEEILEGSAYYSSNMASLHQTMAKLPVAERSAMGRRIIPNIQQTALRMAGVSKADATFLLAQDGAKSINQNVG
jgi:hypothetical protein